MEKNDLNFRTSIGSTHNDITETKWSRHTDGASYNQIEYTDFDADPRGMILETLSGKKYAIWGIDRALTLLKTAGLSDISIDRHDFKPELVNDMEKRYGITVLHGQVAEQILESTISESIIGRAAIDWFSKQKNKTTHDFLRADILMKSGMPPAV